MNIIAIGITLANGQQFILKREGCPRIEAIEIEYSPEAGYYELKKEISLEEIPGYLTWDFAIEWIGNAEYKTNKDLEEEMLEELDRDKLGLPQFMPESKWKKSIIRIYPGQVVETCLISDEDWDGE